MQKMYCRITENTTKARYLFEKKGCPLEDQCGMRTMLAVCGWAWMFFVHTAIRGDTVLLQVAAGLVKIGHCNPYCRNYL